MYLFYIEVKLQLFLSVSLFFALSDQFGNQFVTEIWIKKSVNLSLFLSRNPPL